MLMVKDLSNAIAAPTASVVKNVKSLVVGNRPGSRGTGFHHSAMALTRQRCLSLSLTELTTSTVPFVAGTVKT
jgi:hypothetical protein